MSKLTNLNFREPKKEGKQKISYFFKSNEHTNFVQAFKALVAYNASFWLSFDEENVLIIDY